MPGIITKKGRSRSKVRIDTSEIDQLATILRLQHGPLEREKRRVETKYADLLADKARSRVSRSSGKQSAMSSRYGPLWSSIKSTYKREPRYGVQARVGIGNAFYGLFLEKGTVHMNKRPFMGPAIRQVRKPFRDEAVATVMKLLRLPG
jgi:HK97 gp10 family phage protein